MGYQTPLYKKHVEAGAKIVDFGGWDMPLHYGSQLEEHHIVRNAAGAFDVSHMTVVDLGNGRSRLDWGCTAVARGVEEAAAKTAVEGMYGVLIDWLVEGAGAV